MFARISSRDKLAAWRQPRVILWTVAGVVTLAFFIVLEIVARRVGGEPGPLVTQAKELVFPPKPGPLYAGLALTMVVLTWRQRLIAAAWAVGIDLLFVLGRWAADVKVTDGRYFGNGALWVMLGVAVIALTRRTGRERTLLLKGVGLGLLLVAGRKVGDSWLMITWKTRPKVLDQYVATADHALGNPSWAAGRILKATEPIGPHVLDLVYAHLAVAAIVFALYQLRNVAAERRFPRHHLVRTFLVIGLLGPGIYMLFPVVGPVFAYGPGASGTGGVEWATANIWPHTPPSIAIPHAFTYDDLTPRNCMPSLHTAWATAIFIHSRKGPRWVRYGGAFWLVATISATLGFGYHYGSDVIAGVVFALTIEAGMRLYDRGPDRKGILFIAYGTTVFTAFLLAYRFLPVEMAENPWLFGPLLILTTLSVITGYLRITRQWEANPLTPLPDPKPAAEPQRPEPQPEPV
ncbi:phosphatase PAP2 family protein [Streptomyces mobaraensis]|uniref:phosphatase PAP2 family protein n=1 Tax=Streptomyces mobaraensis TaxID=35621 RepID=UPI0013E0192F|nr:phosphatase PAP2 family protein [Streptomyces mobaraensis]